MKKWEKVYMIITGIVFTFAAILACIVEFTSGKISKDVALHMAFVIVTICIAVLIAMFLLIIIKGVQVLKRGVYNISKCEEEPFKSIDQYKKCWTESKAKYIRCIQIINLYYQPGGRVDKLVDAADLDKLYLRMDFLIVQNTVFVQMMQYMYSLVVSVLATLIMNVIDNGNQLFVIFGVIVIILTFFVMFFLQYVTRGQGGSLDYMINDYEKELLQEKIKECEKKLTITEEDEAFFKTRQIALEALLDIWKKTRGTKRRKAIVEDIEIVEKLNLCLGTYADASKEKIDIKGREGYLVYNTYQEDKDGCVKTKKFKTKDYEMLYKILKKYNILN